MNEERKKRKVKKGERGRKGKDRGKKRERRLKKERNKKRIMKEFLIAHLDHNVDAILVEELLQGKAYNRVVLDCKNQERGFKERRARDIREE